MTEHADECSDAELIKLAELAGKDYYDTIEQCAVKFSWPRKSAGRFWRGWNE